MPYDSIATTKLYLEPDFKGYELTKDCFLAKKLPREYARLSQAEKTEPEMKETPEARAERIKDIQRKKWTLLLDAFEGVSKDLHEKLQNYKTSILSKEIPADNKYVLSLGQLLGFFEQFYFLAYNDEPHYKLDKIGKNDLFTSLGAGIAYAATCEGGFNGHFENIVLRFISVDPTSWIPLQLYKQRAAVIRVMADHYNAKYKVSEGLTQHPHHSMNEAARKAGYGIKPRTIEDAHANLVPGAIAYFKAQAPAKFFADYEQTAIDDLTNHAITLVIEWLQDHNWSEKTKWLKEEKNKGKDPIAAWQEGTGPMRFDKHFTMPDPTPKKESKQESKDEFKDECTVFSRFLQETLGANLHLLGTFNDADTEFSLKKKADFQRGVRRLIETRLQEEAFFLPIANVNQDNIAKCVFRLLPEAKPEDLLASIEKIRKIGTSRADTLLTKKDMLVIGTCPALLTSQIAEEPALWQRLPKSLQNDSLIMGALIATLGQNVSAEVPPGNQDKQLELLHSFIKKSPHYIKQLPAELFTKEHIVRKFFDIEPGSALTTYQELRVNLPPKIEVVKNFPNDCTPEKDPGEFYFNLYRLVNINILVTVRFFSTAQLSNLAQRLSPKELYYIHQERVDRKLPPLPNFNKTLFRNFMHTFDQGVWLKNGYSYIRQESASLSLNPQAVYLTPEFRENLARKSVLGSKDWFLAFLRYQQEFPIFDKAFKSLSDFETQLKFTAKAIWGIIHSLLVFSFELLVLFIPPAIGYLLEPYYTSFLHSSVAYLAPLLTFYFGPVLPYVVLTVLFLYFFNYEPLGDWVLLFKAIAVLFTLLAPPFILALWVETATILTGAAILLLIFPDFHWFTAVYRAWKALMHIVVYWYFAIKNGFAAIQLAVEEIETLLTLLWNAIVPWFTRSWLTLTAAVEQVPTGDEALEIAIEDNILRLDMMNEPTARRKASIMGVLWGKILADPTGTLQEKLQKRYPYSEKEEKGEPLSFQEVAATKRVPGQVFKPKMQDTRCTFFGLRSKRNTTTMDSLNACMQLR